MFSWIRRMVRNAVIDGVNDAAAELTAAPVEVQPVLIQLGYSPLLHPVEEEPVRSNGRQKARG